MDVIIGPFFAILSVAVRWYTWVVVIAVVMSWLVNFNVINTHNRFVHMTMSFFYGITEPALRKIRQFIPSFGGFDLSPVVLILALAFLENVLGNLAFRFG